MALGRQNPLDGWVYFAQPKNPGELGGYPIKIGWSTNPASAVHEAHRWFWFEVRLIGTVPIRYRSPLWGTCFYSLERILHTALRSHRIRGEWFRPNQAVLSFVEHANYGETADDMARRALELIPPGAERRYWERNLARCA